MRKIFLFFITILCSLFSIYSSDIIGVRPDNYNINLTIGDSYTFHLIVTYSDGTEDIVTSGINLESSNPEWVSVEGVTIKARELGVVYFTARYMGMETYFTVNVSPNRLFIGYQLSNDYITLEVGEQASFALQRVYDDGFIKSVDISEDIKFLSSDNSIIKVLNNTVTGFSPGESAVEILFEGDVYTIGVSVGPHAVNNRRIYILGHSLIYHEQNVNPVISNETSVPQWLYEFARFNGENLTVDGQFGFLRNYAHLPPTGQWEFDRVPKAWVDGNHFRSMGFDTVILTAANFLQHQSPDKDYDDEMISPLKVTTNIVNWIDRESPTTPIYIYENWSDMPSAGVKSFPPNVKEIKKYHVFNNYKGSFHKWWLDYHNGIILEHPKVKMIPVGPILSSLYTDLLNELEIEVLYEDETPNGRSTTYFLAAMITYMAINEKMTPVYFTVPLEVDPLIELLYDEIREEIWNQLENFNFPDGSSRVFFD